MLRNANVAKADLDSSEDEGDDDEATVVAKSSPRRREDDDEEPDVHMAVDKSKEDQPSSNPEEEDEPRMEIDDSKAEPANSGETDLQEEDGPAMVVDDSSVEPANSRENDLQEEDGPAKMVDELMGEPVGAEENESGVSRQSPADRREDDLTIVGGDSRGSSPHLRGDGSEKVVIGPRKPSSLRGGSETIDLGSRQRPAHLREVDAGEGGPPMNDIRSLDSLDGGNLKETSAIVVKSKKPGSESDNVYEEGCPANRVRVGEPAPTNGVEPSVTAELEPRKTARHRPGLESENVYEEGRLANGFRVVDPAPMDGIEPSVSAGFELRRSARRNSTKQYPMPNYPAAHKSSTGKKKRPFVDKEVFIEACLLNYNPIKLNNFFFRLTRRRNGRVSPDWRPPQLVFLNK